MTAAPYPADTRAKGWRFELDLERVRQSDTWAKAGAPLRPWLLMLWAVAWEQTPCGSLPDDDEAIAGKLDMPLKQFSAAREKLLRGWYRAEDGRLYHSTLTERVLEMLEYRRKEAARRAGSRGRQHEDGGTPPFVPPVSRGTTTGDTRDDTASPGTGTGTGTTTEADASVGAAKPRASRKCPKAFEPPDAQAWVDEHCPGIDWRNETEKFRDHTFATARTDWVGTWRNWMRKAFESRPGRAAVIPINRQEAIEQRNRAVGDEWLREQEAADASR